MSQLSTANNFKYYRFQTTTFTQLKAVSFYEFSFSPVTLLNIPKFYGCMPKQDPIYCLTLNVLSEFIHSWQQIRYFKFLKKKNTFKEANNRVKHYTMHVLRFLNINLRINILFSLNMLFSLSGN